MLQRLVERIDSSADSNVGLQGSDDRPLGGNVEGTTFRLTAKPTGRPAYVVVACGTVTPMPNGCRVHASVNAHWLFYPLILIFSIVTIAGVSTFVRTAREGRLSFWQAWIDPLGILLIGLVFLLSLLGRRLEERDTIISALRDAAGAT